MKRLYILVAVIVVVVALLAAGAVATGGWGSSNAQPVSSAPIDSAAP